MIIPMATLGSPVCCFMASLITADGDEGTRKFLRNYMTELHAFIVRMLAVVLRNARPPQIRHATAVRSRRQSDGKGRARHMKRVLLVGQVPETADFSDPALPPGLDAQKIHTGIADSMRQMTQRGWQADVCLVRPDETAGIELERQLASATYDCVVIGAGVRNPPKSLLLFEVLINVVRKSAPSASIAFNTRPQDTADAAARWLKGG
jgi:hypothetical protein